MSIISFYFIVFLLVTLLAYFIVPKKYQWVVLLIMSCVFYLSYGLMGGLFVVCTATSIFFAAKRIQKIADAQTEYIKANKATLTKEEKSDLKNKNKRRKKKVLIWVLVLNFGLLCFFKYCHFVIAQINLLSGLFCGPEINDTLSIIMPLGISFYTFQSTGYLLDVYWEYYKAEKNYPKFLLFVSFFPQMTQGPISSYETLSKELFAEHSFDYKNYSWGIQRMLWGFYKKMAIANVAAPMVQNLFNNYRDYSGVSTFIGMFLYSIQIYADFSGYMDIMCGFCEILGIRLTENFLRPYFSKSVAEYWRRWHISLGDWFKKYVYFAIGMSNWSRNLAKKLKDKRGKTLSNNIPATIALVVVWTLTGLWHGASWAYISWGFVNGLFIIFSLWMDPVYDKVKTALKIKEGKFAWRAFQTIRTFILVTFIKVLPEVGTLSDGIGLWRHVFSSKKLPNGLWELFIFSDDKKSIKILILGVVLMLGASLIQRKKSIRQWIEERFPYAIRIFIFVALFVLIIRYGAPASSNMEGFLYGQF